VTAENAGMLSRIADGFIVGISLKRGGSVIAPVDADRARAIVSRLRGGAPLSPQTPAIPRGAARANSAAGTNRSARARSTSEAPRSAGSKRPASRERRGRRG
jgi:hypothetical protein